MCSKTDSLVCNCYTEIADECVTQTEKDFARRLVLTCGLKHVNHFDPDRLVVKANRSGTRARVVFGGDTNRRSDVEPSDQLLLPFAVDSYSLTAQLLADNSLVIEAPVLQ